MRNPISSTSWEKPACMYRILAVDRRTPSMTRIELTTPRYWS